MNDVLKELLWSVLKEELEPIRKDLNVVKNDLSELKLRQEKLSKNLIDNIGQ